MKKLVLFILFCSSLSYAEIALEMTDYSAWNNSDAFSWREAQYRNQGSFENSFPPDGIDTTFTEDLPQRTNGSVDYPDGDYYWLSMQCTLEWNYDDDRQLDVYAKWMEYPYEQSYWLGYQVYQIASGSGSKTLCVRVRFPRSTFDNKKVKIFFNATAWNGDHHPGDSTICPVPYPEITLQPLPNTSTPTYTGTPTYTPTRTPTQTFTPTLTPTMTKTPTGTLSPTMRPYDIYGDSAQVKRSSPGVYQDVINNDEFLAIGEIVIGGRVTNFGRDLDGDAGQGSTIKNGIRGPYPSTDWIISDATTSMIDLPYYWSWLRYTNISIENWETGYYYIRTEVSAVGFTDSNTSNDYEEIMVHLLKPTNTPTYTPTNTPTPTPTNTPTKTPTPWAFLTYYRGGVKYCPLVEWDRRIAGATYYAAGLVNGVSVFARIIPEPSPPTGTLNLKRGVNYYFDKY